jgi:hypothetical protein
MKPLRITLFVIAFVILASQTFRHAYVRWLETRVSVLDKYDTDTDKQISAAQSLHELEQAYDAAYKETKKEEEARRAKGEVESTESKYSRERTEAEKKEDRLRQAIQEWESKNKEIRELHYFWVAGLIALVLGMVIYERMERWTGFALVILAFCEMIWATTLSFHYFLSNNHEFDRLLTQKFSFSVVSLVLLIVSWVALRRIEQRREAAEMLRS